VNPLMLALAAMQVACSGWYLWTGGIKMAVVMALYAATTVILGTVTV
jgi:hypothetical protein